MYEIKNKLLKLFEKDGEKKATTIVTNPESRDPFMLKLKNIYQTCKESAARLKNKILNAAEQTAIDFQDIDGMYKFLIKRENQEKNGFERRKLRETEIKNLYRVTGITGLTSCSDITEMGTRFRNVFIQVVEMNEDRMEQFSQLSPAETLFAGIAIENNYPCEKIQKMGIPGRLIEFINKTPENEKSKAVEFMERNTVTLDDYAKKIIQVPLEPTQPEISLSTDEKTKQAAQLLQHGDQESLARAGKLIKEHNLDKNQILNHVPQDMRVFIKHYGFDQAVRLATSQPVNNMTIEKLR